MNGVDTGLSCGDLQTGAAVILLAKISRCCLSISGSNRGHFQILVSADEQAGVLIELRFDSHALSHEPKQFADCLCRIVFAVELTLDGHEGADMLRLAVHTNEDLSAIDEALRKLEEIDPRAAHGVELRFFGGLTLQEVAEVQTMFPPQAPSPYRLPPRSRAPAPSQNTLCLV